MTRLHAPAADLAPRAPSDAISLARALIETTKPGITRMVALTAAIGFALAALHLWGAGGLGPFWHAGGAFLACLVGTALAAGGANSLNQWLERERDARMRRTLARPIPSSRLTPGTVWRFGAALVAAGVALLWLVVGLMPAALALASALVYVAIYTPSKPVTVWSTVIGTVPGALPALIGWTAAGGALLAPGGQALFWLMVAWQLPHFFALAWVYRADYAAGGMRVLPVADPSGRLTRAALPLTTVLFACSAIVPLFIAPDLTGWVYALVAIASVAPMLYLSTRFAGAPTDARARALFIASILVLPLLFAGLLIDAFLHAVL